MNINSYTFQSPYPNQVQVGRLDSSSKQENTTTDSGSELLKNTNTTLKEAKSFDSTQTNEVKPSVNSSKLLDIYA
nr:hypothetical protein [uncultured Sulfurimonas sp.]